VTAERLPEGSYPDGLGHDLRGRALGALAGALRLDEQLEAARATLAMAWEALDEGSGDPLERAAGADRAGAGARGSARKRDRRS
jgi:hypothetical protein